MELEELLALRADQSLEFIMWWYRSEAVCRARLTALECRLTHINTTDGQSIDLVFLAWGFFFWIKSYTSLELWTRQEERVPTNHCSPAGLPCVKDSPGSPSPPYRWAAQCPQSLCQSWSSCWGSLLADAAWSPVSPSPSCFLHLLQILFCTPPWSSTYVPLCETSSTWLVRCHRFWCLQQLCFAQHWVFLQGVCLGWWRACAAAGAPGSREPRRLYSAVSEPLLGSVCVF